MSLTKKIWVNPKQEKLSTEKVKTRQDDNYRFMKRAEMGKENTEVIVEPMRTLNTSQSVLTTNRERNDTFHQDL